MKQTTRIIIATILAMSMGTLAYAQTNGQNIPPQDNAPRTLRDTSRPGHPDKKMQIGKDGEKGDGQRMDGVASTTDRGDKGENMRNASTSDENNGGRGDTMKQQLGDKLNKMGARFEATLAREDGLVTRILSRIEKIKTAGGKTDTAEKIVTDAKAKIDAAKAMLATLKANVDAQVSLVGTIATSTMSKKDVKTADQNIRKTTMTLEKNIQSAQMSLDKAVKALLKDNPQLGQMREGTTTQN